MPESRTKYGGANWNQLEQYIQNIVQNINKNYIYLEYYRAESRTKSGGAMTSVRAIHSEHSLEY